MRNILIFVVFIVCLVLFQFLAAPTVDEIINKYLAARGGKEKLNSLYAVCFKGFREMMGEKVPVTITKVHEKLFRTDFQFGNHRGFVIATPADGWQYLSHNQGQPQPMNAGQLKQVQGEMDIAGDLLNYHAKGFKAELAGKTIIDGEPAYEIILVDAGGNENNYFIDIQSGLLVQSRKLSKSAGGVVTSVSTFYKDYRAHDGILFPMTMISEGEGMGSGSLSLYHVEINPLVDELLYRPSVDG